MGEGVECFFDFVVSGNYWFFSEKRGVDVIGMLGGHDAGDLHVGWFEKGFNKDLGGENIFLKIRSIFFLLNILIQWQGKFFYDLLRKKCSQLSFISL